MSTQGTELGRLAALLPDIPRWIEARSMLLSGRCEVFGFEGTARPKFAVCARDREITSAIGCPSPEVIGEAVAHAGNKGVLISPLEDAGCVAKAIAGWRFGPATLHLLGADAMQPRPASGAARFISPDEIDSLTRLSPALKEELTIVAPHCLIAAALADDLPVSFCYVAWETETLWDISIETLSEYRGKGYAELAVAFLIEHMKRTGKQPVWGAEESNTASMRLAAKLGFVPVDRLAVFHAPKKSNVGSDV